MDPIFATLSNVLREWGLGELFTVDAQGNPGGWLWNQMRSGVDTADELAFAIQQTDVFRNRFSVIVDQQRRAAAGEAVYVMTPAEVLDYEARARQIMSAAGLPPWLYDQPNDFQRLIANDVSLNELQDKVVAGFEYVNNAPPEVRQAFRDYYGVNGDAALAAWALDPERTVASIQKATRTAYAAGMAQRFDVQIGRTAAERIAELPMTEGGITERLGQVASQRSIFEEGVFEVENLTAENEGVASVFEGNADAQTAIERRVLNRRRINESSIGGAALTNEGLIGSRSVGGG